MRRHELAATVLGVVAVTSLALAGRAPATEPQSDTFDPTAPTFADLECGDSGLSDISMTKDGSRSPVESLDGLDLDRALTPQTVGIPSDAAFYAAEHRVHNAGHAAIVEVRRPVDDSLGAWVEIDYHASHDLWLPGYAAVCGDLR